MRLARDRVRVGGPPVPVLEDLQLLRGPEAGVDAVGAHLPLCGLWLRVGPGCEPRRNLRAFPTATRSAGADAETCGAGRTGLPARTVGAASTGRTIRFRFAREVENFMGSGDRFMTVHTRRSLFSGAYRGTAAACPATVPAFAFKRSRRPLLQSSVRRHNTYGTDP